MSSRLTSVSSTADSLLLTGFRKTHCLIHRRCLQATWATSSCLPFDHQSVVSHNTIWNWIELWKIVKYLARSRKHQLIVGSLIVGSNWLQIRPVLHNDGQQTAPGRSSKSLTQFQAWKPPVLLTPLKPCIKRWSKIHNVLCAKVVKVLANKAVSHLISANLANGPASVTQ